jgi:hypothetical protein
MNRDFILRTVSPAQARLMVMASRIGRVFISPDLVEKSHLDLITRDDVPDAVDDTGLAICQFIADYRHRCVIPYQKSSDQVYAAIAAMIPREGRVLFITDDPILWVRATGERITPFSEKNQDRCQHLRVSGLKPDEMLRQRGAYVVANITPEHVGYEWMGKLFPRMVIYCSQNNQYNLPLGGGMTKHSTAARHAASILYPHVLAVMGSDQNLVMRGDAALPLLGCYNGLLEQVKKSPGGFKLKKYTPAELDDLWGDP